MVWGTWTAIVRRQNPPSSPARWLEFPGVQHPALSHPQERAQWLQAAHQTASGLPATDQAEAQGALAQARGLNHSGPDQRDEPDDQRLEHLFPYRRGQGGVHRPGSFHVPARPAL